MWWGRDREGQVRWTWEGAMAEPRAQGFVTSLKKGSQKWESLEGTRGAGRTAVSACVSGTTVFSSARTRVFSQVLVLLCCYPQCHLTARFTSRQLCSRLRTTGHCCYLLYQNTHFSSLRNGSTKAGCTTALQCPHAYELRLSL